MKNTSLEKALQEAVEMEKRGQAFYAEASKKSQNDVTKRTFEFLANSELLHIESIKNFYTTLKERGEFPALSLDAEQKKRDRDLTIFSKSASELSEKIKPNDDDVKALEFAMDFENSGHRYYEGMLKGAKDTSLIALLKFLLSEESKHYEALRDVYTYVTDTHNWYMYEEGSFPQG